MPTQHLEIERKFDVPPSFTLPDLASVPGVASATGPEERLLEAVYHDTADLRLARSRATLRRRTGGPDEGWHVKLPADGGARRELHFPAGRATRTPPRAVQAPVRGLVRTATLGPVATLNTRRQVTLLCDDAGRVLAEVADDEVTATALAADVGEPATVLSWREIEVELVDGDEALLAAVGERLAAAGARPSPSASKLARVLGQRLATPGPRSGTTKKPKRAGAVVLGALADQVQALQLADLAIRTDQPEGVHDLRVAARRLRSILAAFRTVLDREATDPLREELRWLGLQMAGARDGEVALGHLHDLVARQPDELVLGPVAARIQQTRIKDAEAGRKAAAKALDDSRYLLLLDGLDALVARPPLTPAADARAERVLTEAIKHSGKRLRREVDAARQNPTGSALHEIRKAAKRVRYTAEVAVPVLGGRARKVRKAAKRAQSVLGHRQDTTVTREFCRTLGLAAFAAGENAWTFGRLSALEEARGERAAADFWATEPRLARAVRRAAS